MRTEEYSLRHAWDKRLGLPVGSVEQAVHYSDIWTQAQLGQISPIAYWKGVAELLKISMEDVDELRRDYFSKDKLDETLVTLIRQLRNQGYTIALLSNESITLEARLIELHIHTLFDSIFISFQHGIMKPSKAAYQHVLQELDILPREAIFIDDSPINVQAAQREGIHAILFHQTLDLEREIMQYITVADNERKPDPTQVTKGPPS